MKRPIPPSELSEPGSRFLPAPEVELWLRQTFIKSGGHLHSKEHEHLHFAEIGVLWTNAYNSRRGMEVVGTAEMPFFKGDAWQKARQEFQLREWFGRKVDFVITLSAPWACEAPDNHFCAVAEHEVLHCGQAKDDLGFPKWNKNGPRFAIRGHDFEQFHSIAERYGAEAAGLSRLAEIFKREPTINAEAIQVACGSC
jgi:hypothetical protein